MTPRLLDLFCSAGGAAMGYHRAGFDVVGVDIKPQPHYPFEFIRADALVVLDGIVRGQWGDHFQAIHASPPCQFASAGGNLWITRLGPSTDRHPNLIAPTRERLLATGLPYVIENVDRARRWLREPVLICGRAMGLGVKRHRLFESSEMLFVPPCPSGHPGEWISVFGGGGLSRTPPGGQARIDGRHNGRGASDGRVHIAHSDASEAMGIDWMTRDELSEAIPPAYTEWIGRQLIASLRTPHDSDYSRDGYLGWPPRPTTRRSGRPSALRERAPGFGRPITPGERRLGVGDGNEDPLPTPPTTEGRHDEALELSRFVQPSRPFPSQAVLPDRRGNRRRRRPTRGSGTGSAVPA